MKLCNRSSFGVVLEMKKELTAILLTSGFWIVVIWFGYDNNRENQPSERNLTRNSEVIFFHETSGASVLNSRQACSVESAANMNPNSTVHLLMTSSYIDKTNTLMKQLLLYDNVYIKHIDMKVYFQGTPLEDLYNSGALNRSKWPVSHTSDALRYLTLWKMGGTYLDLDVLLLKSLEGFRNYAGAEHPGAVAAGVINFDHGHPMLAACIEELRTNFQGHIWSHNGPGVITRVLKATCIEKNIPGMLPNKCGGFTVFPPYAFYPIPYWRWWLYFDEEKSNKTMEDLYWSFAAHVWNKLSAGEKIRVGSNQPYSRIAKKVCPKVYSNSGGFM